MENDPRRWRNVSPADLDCEVGWIEQGNVDAAVAAADACARDWSALSLEQRCDTLCVFQAALQNASPELARGISIETGKPIREATGEVGAVVAKIGLTISDAQRWLSEEAVSSGPHPARIRRLARGPAAVVAPFNFPLHLGHGAAMAHLVAGNPVLLKPSPLAGLVAQRYGEIAAGVFPKGVYQTVQGWGGVGRALCQHPRVRSVCFTGSAAVGKSLLRDASDDLGKEIALELGGKNAALICMDANLELAALAIAEGACLTAGQRCNATSRVIVAKEIASEFSARLSQAMRLFVPGDPLEEATRLGPLISLKAVERYSTLTALDVGEWILPGEVVERVNGKRGCWVLPALVLCRPEALGSALHCGETFAPVVEFYVAHDESEMLRLHDTTPYGLTATIFTTSRDRFERLAAQVRVGNVYANLPTTFSPSTLPFGGLGESGNRRPGGGGFVRWTTDEQAVQWLEEGFSA